MKRHKLVCVSFLLFFSSIFCQTPYPFEDFEYSLIYPFNNVHWYFIGAMVKDTSIYLTPDMKSKTGSIWCQKPANFRDWEIQVQFKIFGHGETLYGDGLALWYVKEPGIIGPIFGYKNESSGLGIILDTYKNNHGSELEFPYISVQVSDVIKYNNDHDGVNTQIAGASAPIRGKDATLIVTYVNNELEVKIHYINTDKAQTLIHTKGIHLPSDFHFGASAATGDLTDNHVITSFKVYPIYMDHKEEEIKYPKADYFTPPKDHMEKPVHAPMTTKKLVLIIILALIGLAVLFVVGVVVFKKQEESRKRLY